MKIVIISALTTFVYVGASSLIGAIAILRKYGDKPDWMVFLACGLLAAIATVKDIRSTMRMPPVNAIDMDEVRKLLEQQKK